ncbi:hypothetical protein K373_03712 [Streptomyces sp. DvalAA-21]|nr:PE-PGRS family protein [Streptomyces sp. SirexAA-E]PZX37575.1 hypothetical protein K373_03712 [Streptomyces sp. DvalAA-21]RAJ33732.1 hypothetical protein K351_03290 [Streptomyces sp. DpondAA-E10]RAJ48328.1 hypothetical protein K352_02852 [Streptomyces sp. DpondAA-A50]SCM07662.1 hypothetical protein SAMN04883147_1072165 [Streptomyces sp. DpondAA-F4]
MGDQDETEPAPPPDPRREQVQQRTAADRVEARGDLVADQHPGPDQEGPGEGGAPGLAAGELTGAPADVRLPSPSPVSVRRASAGASGRATPRSRVAVGATWARTGRCSSNAAQASWKTYRTAASWTRSGGGDCGQGRPVEQDQPFVVGREGGFLVHGRRPFPERGAAGGPTAGRRAVFRGGVDQQIAAPGECDDEQRGHHDGPGPDEEPGPVADRTHVIDTRSHGHMSRRQAGRTSASVAPPAGPEWNCLQAPGWARRPRRPTRRQLGPRPGGEDTR